MTYIYIILFTAIYTDCSPACYIQFETKLIYFDNRQNAVNYYEHAYQAQKHNMIKDLKMDSIPKYLLNFSDMNVKLTNRELEVSRLTSYDMPNKIIADKLGISIETVNNHLKNIYRKLDIHGRAALTRYYILRYELHRILKEAGIDPRQYMASIILLIAVCISLLFGNDFEARRVRTRMGRRRDEYTEYFETEWE